MAASLLERIADFRGLAALADSELPELCSDIRKLIIDVTLKNGGHLGGSLGAVEICVALLRAFDPGSDRIIFDVGHQSYAYKILTGRLADFHTLRTKGGISGFPRRSESIYDVFDTGHSSTSISAALGFAKARDLAGEEREVVAVIGDGALLNGMAFEALNNVDACGTKITIVLNDNKMSISPRVGGMASHLARLAVSSPYRRFKGFLKDRCRSFASGMKFERGLRGIKSKLKSLILPTNMFEAMEISYWGPFDGHSAAELSRIFELSKRYPDPLLIHVITQKGRGCDEAEKMPAAFHGVGRGTRIGEPEAPKPRPNDWSQAVADCAVSAAESDPRVVACTAAMADGTRLSTFEQRFPERTFDVGIAEGHMLTFAAGMAAAGMRPVVCIYSTFLQRAEDQLVHDICMQRLPVLVAVDRSGLNGEDGETHQGLLDIAWGRAVPGLTVCCPRDVADLELMFREWLARGIPMCIRYPKGTAPRRVARADGSTPAPWHRAEVLRRGSELCLIGIGATVEPMLAAAEGSRLDATVADLRFASPLDLETIDELLTSHEIVITAEDGYLDGGVGEAVAARACEIGARCRVERIGVGPDYVPHATRQQQLEDYGLTAEAIASAAERLRSARAASMP